MKKKYRILKFLIPVVLLCFIISKIDFVNLGEIFDKSNKLLLSLAFLSFPLRYIIFTLRWKIVLGIFGNNHISFIKLLKTIYVGFFAGFFVPASVGIDIYRVFALRNTNTNHINIGLIFQEKLMGLVVCGFFVLLFSNYIGIDMGNIYPYIRDGLYAIIIITLAILMTLLFFKRNSTVQHLIKYIEKKLTLLIKYFAQKFKKEVKIEEGFFNKVLTVSLYPKMILIVALFGILNQLVGAIFSNIGFKAMGVELDLVYNLFANPLMNIIFLLPISFGGFGIREGAYIVIFGLVGIAAEVSLLVSFIFMASGFLNVGIGGIVFLLDKKKLNV